MFRHTLCCLSCIGFTALAAVPRTTLAQSPTRAQVIEPRMVHLRSGPVREWSSFPEQAEAAHHELRFSAERNAGECALRLRQQDIKQAWRVSLNGKPLGGLVRDENDQILYLPVPPGAVVDGENTLRIDSTAQGEAVSDDIGVGEMWLDRRPAIEALSESILAIRVIDEQTRSELPGRITIVNSSGALQALGTKSSDKLAVRSGVVYTADGHAQISLPAGQYTVFAGRGSEYSLAKIDVDLAAGETIERTLAIRREVATPGYVACDTHIHTLTHSGHGDASITERMITLAGEGIELPIATDHNVHIDYQPHAERLGVRRHFTPVMGNEVTTPAGHFNVFPVAPSARIPDYKQRSWGTTFDEIFGTPGVKIAILNHARDLHSGTRPFGPKLFNAAIGENIDDWPMRFNAMEIINSGATQTDPLRLVKDWMALLNRGYRVSPIGSSDSHDVSRYIVGQGRTYIRCDDRDPGAIDVSSAVDNLLAGRVLVSYGLLIESLVDGKYRSGDVAQLAGDEFELSLNVLAPSWVEANLVQLYANGELVREESISVTAPNEPPGCAKWQATWRLPRPKHDAHLVAVALGPGIASRFWPTAKPYQPTSPDWTPYVMGVSGAIWLDADGDGRQNTPRAYAERLFADCGGEPDKLIASLAVYDAATTAQAAHLLHVAGKRPDSGEVGRLMQNASPAVRQGFHAFHAAWRENERARAVP